MASPMEIMLGMNRDKATMDAMSQGLRRNKDVAQLAMLSGDQTVGGFGGVLSGDVERRVAQRLTEREKKAQRDLTQGYYDQLGSQHQDMMGFRQAQLAEAKRANDLRHQAAVLTKTLGKTKPPTDKAMQTANDAVAGVENLKFITQSFDDSYAKGNRGKGSFIPFEGDLTNWIGRTALGDEKSKAQAEWWGAYQNLYELPQRNEMFGSALTDTEKQAWKDANIDPNMPADTIRNRLATLQGIYQRNLNRMAEQHAMVYDPEWVQQTYGPYYGGGQSSGASGGADSVEYPTEAGSAPTGVVDWSEMDAN